MAPKKDQNTNGAPSTVGIAADASTLAAGGVTASKPEDTGQSSGTTSLVVGGAGPTIAAVGEIGPEAVMPSIAGGSLAESGFFNPREEVLRVTHLNQLENLSVQVDAQRHPRVVEFFLGYAYSDDEPPSAIRVICSVDGFCRGGHRHAAGAATHALDHFTADQLEQLLGDATFTVELI